MPPIEIDFSKLELSLQPHVLASILQLKEDSDTSFADLEKLIKSDQNLTGFILKAANSPLYARGNEIRKLQHAISLLGFRVIRSLASAAGSRELFKTGNYARFRKYVWQHSVASAVISLRILDTMGRKDLKEEVFVAALLHDLGKVILNTVDRKKFIEVLDMAEKGGVSFEAAEQELFGTNHMEVGARAARAWKLPAIYEYILGHHNRVGNNALQELPEQDRPLILASTMANIIANLNGYGIPGPQDSAELDNALIQVGISEEKREETVQKLAEGVENDEFYKFFIALV